MKKWIFYWTFWGIATFCFWGHFLEQFGVVFVIFAFYALEEL